MFPNLTASTTSRVLSGITPSGSLTLGNYLGALRRFVTGQDGHGAQSPSQQGFFFIADLHAMTTAHHPERQRALTLETAALFFASGLDPDRSTVFIQSHVRAHVELAYLLECTAYVGELGRMIQFKEKGGRPKTRASLFTYPCLMAADILLYDAASVPVGGDQDQHVEACRDLAMRFNRTYGDTFVAPEELAKAALAARVADLVEPTSKMSKSAPDNAAGVIRMLDPPDRIRRKINRAVTDSDAQVAFDPESKPGVSNMLDIIAVIDDRQTEAVAADYSSYGDLKAACSDAVVGLLEPIQSRHRELMADSAVLTDYLARGAAKAAEQADPVLARAKRAIGLVGV